jgi:hypothetical protein
MPIRTIKDIPSAAWWPEFLAVKDSMTWGDLAEKFGVSAIALRKALESTGATKVAQPRGRKPRAVETPAAPDALARFRSKLGKVADEKIAAKAGVSRNAVGAYRRRLGIPAYDGFRFGGKRGSRGVARAGHVTAALEAVVAPVATPAVAKVAASTTSGPTRRKRHSVIDAYADMIGKATDSKIAALAGVTPAAVTQYRHRAGIARFVPPKASRSVDHGMTEIVDPTHVPAHVVVPPASNKAHAAPLDAYRDRIGLVADHVIAALAGVTLGKVGQYRRKAGIPAYNGFRFEKKRPRRPRTEDRPVPASLPSHAKPVAPVPDPASSAGTKRRRSTIDAHVHLLGKVTDAEVAAISGVTAQAVQLYRKRFGIGKFEPSKATAEVVDASVSDIGVPGRRHVSAVATQAPASPLDAFRDDMGKVADHVIAARAGVKLSVVGYYRRKMGIPAYDGFRVAKGRRPGGAKAAPVEASLPPVTTLPPVVETGLEALPAAPVGVDVASVPVGPVFDLPPEFDLPAPVAADEVLSSFPPSVAVRSTPRKFRPSHIDAYADLVGHAPDAEVARIAGVTREAVRQYRLKRGIPNRTRASTAATPIAPVEVAAIVPAPLVDLSNLIAPRAAFTVRAQAGSRSERFMLVAGDLADAALRCRAAISRRNDGPWIVSAIEKFAETLE